MLFVPLGISHLFYGECRMSSIILHARFLYFMPKRLYRDSAPFRIHPVGAFLIAQSVCTMLFLICLRLRWYYKTREKAERVESWFCKYHTYLWQEIRDKATAFGMILRWISLHDFMEFLFHMRL